MVKNAIAVLPGEADALPQLACPLCHTVNRGDTSPAVSTDTSWQCRRCGQRWDASRLETAAAYARSIA